MDKADRTEHNAYMQSLCEYDYVATRLSWCRTCLIHEKFTSIERIQRGLQFLARFGNQDFCPSLNRYVNWLKQPIGWFTSAGFVAFILGLFGEAEASPLREPFSDWWFLESLGQRSLFDAFRQNCIGESYDAKRGEFRNGT